MDTTTRLVVGAVALFAIQVVTWTTVIYWVRRRKGVTPRWSWVRTLGMFFVLSVLVTGLTLVPGVGRLIAVVASLVGLKRFSGLDVLPTFILSFCVGLSLFVVAGLISNALQVDLLRLSN